MIAALLSLLLAIGPPAPEPDPEPPHPIIGRWDMHWASGIYDTFFFKDGTYRADDWVGSWCFRNGILWVSETMTPRCADTWTSWGVKFLVKTRSGTICSGDFIGTTVKLKRK